jgi:hypothetical protein
MRRFFLLLEAAIFVAGYRCALWLLPFRLLNKPPRISRRRTATPARLAWAIAAAAARIPRSTCLVRALAARRLLARHGYASTLHLGVARAPDGLDAHAWLECQGAILLGAPAPGRYTPLPARSGDQYS